jgi:hypothetical protein
MIAVILGIFVCCFLLERGVPGWRLPSVRTWPLRVLLVNCVQVGVVLLAAVRYSARAINIFWMSLVPS